MLDDRRPVATADSAKIAHLQSLVMKAVIPLAGKGTRLRPLTHSVPKPLLRVAGKPVLDYVLDALLHAGMEEAVFVVGHLGERIRSHVAGRFPELRARYATQEVQDGTAGAVGLAEPWIDGELFVVFADAVYEADLRSLPGSEPEAAAVVLAHEVEDYQRYGVIVTDAAGDMTRIVEKPSEPVSKLANIGLYYVRDHALFFEGIRRVLASPPGPSGEHYLTDAFQHMVDAGAKVRTAPVEGWHDTGKVEALLAANRRLLARGRSGVASGASVTDSVVSPSARVEAGAAVVRSRVGENVVVEARARVTDSDLEDAIVGAGASVADSRLRGSIVGDRARVRGVEGALLIADDSQVLCGGKARKPL